MADMEPQVARSSFDTETLVLNMGPQHPATHGVLRVKLKLDGEKVVGSECVIGYLHRGVEKIAENRTYQQFAPDVDRMDYVAAASQTGWVTWKRWRSCSASRCRRARSSRA